MSSQRHNLAGMRFSPGLVLLSMTLSFYISSVSAWTTQGYHYGWLWVAMIWHQTASIRLDNGDVALCALEDSVIGLNYLVVPYAQPAGRWPNARARTCRLYAAARSG
jgi:hypothetical protein